MIIPELCVFQTKDGQSWIAVECFTDNFDPDKGPTMVWQLYDTTGNRKTTGYLYKTGRYFAGIKAAKRCAQRKTKGEKGCKPVSKFVLFNGRYV